MDYVWNPWRWAYISGKERKQGCVFCDLPKENKDDEHFILHRARLSYIILNIFPYTSGHLMIVPFEHQSSLAELPDDTTNEMMSLAKVSQRALAEEYKPDGFNIGMNLGAAAGAGIAQHVHLHAVPRWIGDGNFMSVIGETRMLPESLENTLQRLKPYFQA
ncbi:MAG: HIT domain-containing protein [Candidatus Obscuribacterales bacterium]|jgi:ATP adenylyltransferase